MDADVSKFEALANDEWFNQETPIGSNPSQPVHSHNHDPQMDDFLTLEGPPSMDLLNSEEVQDIDFGDESEQYIFEESHSEETDPELISLREAMEKSRSSNKDMMIQMFEFLQGDFLPIFSFLSTFRVNKP